MGRYIVSFIGKDAATAAKASARSLLSLRTCSSFQAVRMLNFCLTKETYFAIQGSLDSNSALTCPTTSCESLRIKRLLAPTARARSSPAIMASYFDSLLEALKPRRTACSILSPVGEVNCKPIPAPNCLEAPSTQRIHQPFLFGQVLGCGISTRKSAKTCPFFESLGLYWMPYLLSSIAHRAILLDISGLWIVPRSGRLVSTTTGWAWKYGQSFWAAVRRAKAAYSRWVYLVSALVKDLLIKNTDLNFASPHSLNKAALTAISDDAK